jgi:hypothetical protein
MDSLHHRLRSLNDLVNQLIEEYQHRIILQSFMMSFLHHSLFLAVEKEAQKIITDSNNTSQKFSDSQIDLGNERQAKLNLQAQVIYFIKLVEAFYL